MKKIKIILVSFAVISLVISTIYVKSNYNYYEPGENSSFKLKVGEEFSIKLHENPSTGYLNCWLNENSSNCIEKVNENYEAGLNSKLGYVGAGGISKITFKAKKKGIDTVKIGNCPLGRERKTCKDYNITNSQIDNEFYITIE